MLVFGGSAASGEWKVFLAWRNRTPFGVTDKHFGKDIAFFVFDYPWLRVLLGFGYSIVLLSLVAAIITHYLYGGFRPSAKGQKASGAAQVQFSVLLGLLVLLKAFSYWLDRFGQTTSDSRLFTGISYTGDQRGPAQQGDPGGHRRSLCRAVLRERGAQDLAAARRRHRRTDPLGDPARRAVAGIAAADPGPPERAGERVGVHHQEHRGDPAGLRAGEHQGHRLPGQDDCPAGPAGRRRRSTAGHPA